MNIDRVQSTVQSRWSIVAEYEKSFTNKSRIGEKKKKISRLVKNMVKNPYIPVKMTIEHSLTRIRRANSHDWIIHTNEKKKICIFSVWRRVKKGRCCPLCRPDFLLPSVLFPRISLYYCHVHSRSITSPPASSRLLAILYNNIPSE